MSDTHGHLDKQMLKYINQSDEIWHAGDIGSSTVLDRLRELKPTIAVYGNIDDQTVRSQTVLDAKFRVENVKVWMTHIGGYPNNYDRRIRSSLSANPPKIFISGHSHILKVIYDKKLGLLHLNPGAVGKNGFHKVRTMLRFEIDNDQIKNLEIIELEKRK